MKWSAEVPSGTRGGDGGLRPRMDDSDGMGGPAGCGAQPRGTFCPPQAPKNLGNSLRMYENAPTFTHLEHCHCRFRRRIFYIPLHMCSILTFHNQISSSSSHSFRNPLYETHLLSLSICFKYAKKTTYRVIAMYFKAVREYFSSPVITHKPSSLGIPPEAGIDLMGPTECSREVRSHVSHHHQREL